MTKITNNLKCRERQKKLPIVVIETIKNRKLTYFCTFNHLNGLLLVSVALVAVTAATSLSSFLLLLLLPLLISPPWTNVLLQTRWQRQPVMALILYALEMRGNELCWFFSFSCFSSLSLYLSFCSRSPCFLSHSLTVLLTYIYLSVLCCIHAS